MLLHVSWQRRICSAARAPKKTVLMVREGSVLVWDLPLSLPLETTLRQVNQTPLRHPVLGAPVFCEFDL